MWKEMSLGVLTLSFSPLFQSPHHARHTHTHTHTHTQLSSHGQVISPFFASLIYTESGVQLSYRSILA